MSVEIMKRMTHRNDNGFMNGLPRLVVSAAGVSDRGLVRRSNEDRFLIAEGENEDSSRTILCAVADGMGGHDFGEMASAKAVEVLRTGKARLDEPLRAGFDYPQWLEQVIQTINTSVRRISTDLQASKPIGSTLVASLFTGHKAYVAGVGDSRVYLVRQGCLRRITTDHSFVGLLVEKGIIAPEEIYTHPRRGEIMRFLGQEEELTVDLFELDISPGDTFLLCSDGLWEMVRDNEILSILRTHHNLHDVCRALVKRANQAGGTDNITAIVVSVKKLV